MQRSACVVSIYKPGSLQHSREQTTADAARNWIGMIGEEVASHARRVSMSIRKHMPLFGGPRPINLAVVVPSSSTMAQQGYLPVEQYFDDPNVPATLVNEGLHEKATPYSRTTRWRWPETISAIATFFIPSFLQSNRPREKRPNETFAALDGLRGLACLCVFNQHYTAAFTSRLFEGGYLSTPADIYVTEWPFVRIFVRLQTLVLKPG